MGNSIASWYLVLYMTWIGYLLIFYNLQVSLYLALRDGLRNTCSVVSSLGNHLECTIPIAKWTREESDKSQDFVYAKVTLSIAGSISRI